MWEPVIAGSFLLQLKFCIYFYGCKYTYARCSGRFCESSRPFLCTYNMYYYQQRCPHKTSNQKSINTYLLKTYPQNFQSPIPIQHIDAILPKNKVLIYQNLSQCRNFSHNIHKILKIFNHNKNNSTIFKCRIIILIIFL